MNNLSSSLSSSLGSSLGASLKNIINSVSNTDINNYDIHTGLNNKQSKSGNQEFDLDYYNGAPLAAIYKEMGCTADNRMANRMKYLSLQNKVSADIASKNKKKALQPYLEEELRANENRDWWDQENDWMDNFM